MSYFDKKICNDFDSAIKKEWLETNGIGGYASSTIIGVNTRGYHGLLVSASKPPLCRQVLLSKFEETLIIDNERFELSTNQYPGTIYPQGYRYLDSFRLDPFPIFRYHIANTVLEKTVFMLYGENATAVKYKLVEGEIPVTIQVRPLVACRGFHERRRETNNVHLQWKLNSFAIDIDDITVTFYANKGVFHIDGHWYKNFEYLVELQRGYEYLEDLFNPGFFATELSREDNELIILTSDGDLPGIDLGSLYYQELKLRDGLICSNSVSNIDNDKVASGIRRLLISARHFLVKRDEHVSVIAGYHWFGDWGRDSMISLPGLTLVSGKYETAQELLMTYAKYCKQGLIPNRFSECNCEPEYNSVDASLWFIYAVKKYYDYTGDIKFVGSELYPVIREIIDHYSSGTLYNIHADEDGLIYAGEEGIQLTWMDAKIGEVVVTQRKGKAVEVNALWYNALKTASDISHDLGYDVSSREFSQLAEKVKDSFNLLFWNPERGCLYDYVDIDHFDDAVRPNQIFSISLPYVLLSKNRASSVLSVVQEELLTPYGLRSLSPKHKDYIGRYEGDQSVRDKAYHQGTVWTWLLGHFITAYIKVYGNSEETRNFVMSLLFNIVSEHLEDAGVGFISEIFDGDPPHHPRGCIAQAWSVAEILRAYFEMCLSQS